ncbi:MAG: hypothetical protein IKO39_04810 [Treponema sp.]|nr:hypothetical protein [Treponema sp.]
MKKILLFISVIPLFFFFACDDFSGLEIPEKISVKTGAKFEIPMGNGDIQIRKKASIEEIQKILDDNITSESSTQTKPVVYEYNPADSSGNIDDSAIMQYIINYPIKEIPLSIGDKNLEHANIDEIKIPETKFEAPDFNSKISDTLSIEGKTFPMAEPGALGPKSISDLGFYFNITSPTFGSMKVRTGSMKITIEPPTATTVSGDFSMMVKILLVNASDHSQVITTSGDSLIECAQGKEISLNLEGKEIVQNMYIMLEGEASGGTVGEAHVHTYSVAMAPSSDFALEKITGLTMTDSDLGDYSKIYIPKDFNLNGLNSSLKEATIGKGSLDFYCKLPDGWSGITVKESHFMIEGGVNIANEDFNKDGDIPEGYALYKIATLDNKKVVPEAAHTYDTDSVTVGDKSTYTDENISWLKVALENATIIFADTSAGETTELELSGVCKIEELTNIKISLSELQTFSGSEETGINFSTILSDVMKGDSENLIKDIKFADSDTASLEGYLYVSKPIEDDVLDNLTISGKVSATYKDEDGNAGKNSPMYLFGSDSTNGTMSMIKPEITFEEAAVDGIITNSEVISDKCWSCDINAPETLGGERKHLIRDLINDLPDDLAFSYNLGLDSTAGELDLDGDTIQLLKTTDAKISVSLALVLPLQITLHDEYDIPDGNQSNHEGKTPGKSDGVITIKDVQSLAKSSSDPDKDLLDRDSAKDTDFLKYTDSLKTLYMSYSVVNNLILNAASYTDAEGNEHPAGEDLDLKLTLYTVDLNGDSKDIFDPDPDTGKCEKVIPVADGRQKLEFSPDEVQKILSKDGWPFIPKIRAEITVPKNDSDVSQVQYVPRDGEFAVSGTLHIEFDKDISVEVWSK